MITFKQYLLQETNYGSLVDKERHDSLDKADQALYKYTADAFTPVSPHYDKLNKKYPYEGGVLYRGLHFSSQEQHDKFLASIEDGTVEIKGASSWTPSEETAEDFAHSKKSYFPTPELMYAAEKQRKSGDHMTGYGGVVLKTKVKNGVGIDVRKSGFAKESEVILPTGTYEVEVAKLLEPYTRKYDTPEKVNKILAQMNKAKDRDKEMDRLYEYVLKSWGDKLTPEQNDILIKYQYAKLFSIDPEVYKEDAVTYEVREDYFSRGDEQPLRVELYVHVPVGYDMYKKATSKLQAKIDKLVKVVIKQLSIHIQKLVNEPKLDKIGRFDVHGIEWLREFDPSAVAKAVAPLKKELGNRYHQMNSRESNLKIKTRDDMEKHTEKITQVLTAITKL